MRALGQGSLPVTATMLTAQWFVKRRGWTISVVILGLAASNALLPPLRQSFISSFGWREAYMALRIMVWLLLKPASILVVRNRPEAVGLHPDGTDNLVEEPGGGAPEEHGDSRKVLPSPDFWLLAVPLAAVPVAVTALVFHQISILGELGIAPVVAASIFVIFAIASAAATSLSGFITEKLGPRKPLGISLGLLFLGVIGLQFAATPFLAAVYAAVVGASAGIQGVVAGTIWAHYYGRHGLGRVQGPATMVMISDAALAPLPIAALHQFSGDYVLGLAVMAAVPGFCAAMLYFFDLKRAVRGLA